MVHIMKIIKKAIVYIGSVLMIAGCQKSSRRDFFKVMRSEYEDIALQKNFFFLKDFGIEEQSFKIKDKKFWRIHSGENSFFYLNGYIREENDCIMFIKANRNVFNIGEKETKLFDFKAKKGGSWKISFGKVGDKFLGDSIIYTGNKIEPYGIVYKFEFHPYKIVNKQIRYIDKVLEVCVNKTFGIVSIGRARLTGNGYDYLLLLYPEQRFFNFKGNAIDI